MYIENSKEILKMYYLLNINLACVFNKKLKESKKTDKKNKLKAVICQEN